jgi:hypothetical protein
MREEENVYEVYVAYKYFVCYTVTGKTSGEAQQKILDGDGDLKSNIAQPDVRLPPYTWRIEKIRNT